MQNDSVTATDLFNLLTNATGDAVWYWNLTTDVIWWSEGYTTLFGPVVPAVEEGGLAAWSHAIHPDDREQVLANIRRRMEQGDVQWSEEYRRRRADGQYITVLDRGCVTCQNGHPVQMAGSMQDISGQLALVQARQDSEEKLRFALDSAQLGTWQLDPASGIVSWDARCQALCGLAGQDLQNFEQTLTYIHADDRERVSQAVLWALEPASGGQYDASFRTIDVTDGTVRWVRFRGKTYFTESGVAYRFSGVAQDITEEVVRSEKAALSEQQARMALEGSGAGSFLINLATNEILYSPAFSRILTGENKADLSRDIFVRYIHADDRSTRDEAHRVAVQTGLISYEARFIWEDGTTHWARIQGQYLFDASGKPVSISGIVLDNTEQKEKAKALLEAEARLRTSEERLRNMIIQAPVAIGMLNGRDLIIETANKFMLAIWRKDQSIIGQPLVGALPELARQELIGTIADVFNSGVAQYWVETPIWLNQNDESDDAYVNFVYAPIRNDRQVVTGVAVTAVDVTTQVKARQAVEKSELRFRTLLEAIVQITWTSTPAGEISFFNQRWYDYTEQKFSQLEDTGWWEAMHPDDRADTRTAYEKSLADGSTFEVENRYRRGLDGQYRWHLNRALPIRDETGAITLWVGTATDIQGQKQVAAELEQLVQARTEELTASNFDLRRSNENLEKFAYIASHDLQEPLRKIQSFGDILKNQYGSQLDEGVDYLERMQGAARRMSSLIKDLLTFSRISTRQETSQPVNLNRVIESVVQDMELNGARLTVDTLPVVLGDESQLRQLFLNLLSNALKFHQPDTVSHVAVTACRVKASERPPHVNPSRRTIQYHCISVADNGIGFDEKYLDRIFQVFQRLHNRSEYAGTGIGLAICEKVAANHGGAITATSQPGAGATFSIYLPAS